ncbi:MAG: type III secretion system translocon subunit SctB [Comamonas sp.]
MTQNAGAAGGAPFIPTPLHVPQVIPGQHGQAAASVARKEFNVELLGAPPASAPAKTAAAVAHLPTPTVYTPAPTTMAHLGALGDNQTSADIYSFMALFQKMAQEMRNTSRTQRTAELQSQTSALQSAASEMKSAAKSRFVGAIVQGSMQIAGGLAQAGLSARAASKTLQGSQMKSEGKGMLTELKEGSASMGPARQAALKADGGALISQSKIAEAAASRAQGYAQAAGSASALGNMIGSGFTLKADLHDARRAELEAQASVHGTAVQHANDNMQQMMDVIRDVREKLQSMQQSAVETNRGIARNI